MTTFIDIDNVSTYLMDRGLLDVCDIVDGDLEIIDASRKNRNIKILKEKGQSYLVKQPFRGDFHSADTLKKEGRLYQSSRTDRTLARLKEITPHLFHLDPESNIIILEYIQGQSLWNRMLESQTQFPLDTFRSLGNAMASYHTLGEDVVRQSLSFLPSIFPPQLIIVRPRIEVMADISQGALQVLRIVQRYSDICNFLEGLYSDWHMLTLIHNDVKWDNILVIDSEEPGIKFVDWEMAIIGDPGWDIGCVFEEFISFWLSSMPAAKAVSAESIVTSSTDLQQNMQETMRVFWQSYLNTARIKDPTIADDLLIRSIKYCAARLLQMAYDSLQDSPQLSNRSVRLLQVGQNIARNIDSAALHLIGIPIGGNIL